MPHYHLGSKVVQDKNQGIVLFTARPPHSTKSQMGQQDAPLETCSTWRPPTDKILLALGPPFPIHPSRPHPFCAAGHREPRRPLGGHLPSQQHPSQCRHMGCPGGPCPRLLLEQRPGACQGHRRAAYHDLARHGKCHGICWQSQGVPLVCAGHYLAQDSPHGMAYWVLRSMRQGSPVGHTFTVTGRNNSEMRRPEVPTPFNT